MHMAVYICLCLEFMLFLYHFVSFVLEFLVGTCFRVHFSITKPLDHCMIFGSIVRFCKIDYKNVFFGYIG